MKQEMTYEMKKLKIAGKLGDKELLCQLAEECGELVQAAHKVRRSMKGTTPVSVEEAKEMLNEESADVLLCLGMLNNCQMIDTVLIKGIQREKLDRWYSRTFGEKE